MKKHESYIRAIEGEAKAVTSGPVIDYNEVDQFACRMAKRTEKLQRLLNKEMNRPYASLLKEAFVMTLPFETRAKKRIQEKRRARGQVAEMQVAVSRAFSESSLLKTGVNLENLRELIFQKRPDLNLNRRTLH